MSGENETLKSGNSIDEVNQLVTGESSASDRPMINRDSENVFGTVEDEHPGPSPSKDDKGTDAEKADAGKKAAEEKAAADAEAARKAEEDRFDKHPRFQELIKTQAELRERLAKAEGALEASRRPAEPEKQTPLPYKDITQMQDDELRDWQNEDPKGYAANLYAQARHELMQEIKGQTQADMQQKGVRKTFDEYAAKNSDFMPMWESGQIPKFMEQNPGHNAISAHIILKQGTALADLDKRIKEEVAKAEKAAEERAIKNFQAKKRAAVLPGGATLPAGEDDELKDTKSRGGLVSALTERLLRGRRESGTA